MIQATCTKEFKDDDGCIKYRIKDRQGNVVIVTDESLKKAMLQGNIAIDNLVLTQSNRIISNCTIIEKRMMYKVKRINGVQGKNLIFKSNAGKFIAKAKVVGIELFEIGEDLYVTKENENVLIISSKKIQLPEDCYSFFERTKFKSIDLRDVDTHKVVFMNNMFFKCEAQSLELSNFDTSNVIDMGGMFYKCSAQSLDLTSFDTSKVRNMQLMFNYCKAQLIDISSFDKSVKTYLNNIFKHYNGKIIVNKNINAEI